MHIYMYFALWDDKLLLLANKKSGLWFQEAVQDYSDDVPDEASKSLIDHQDTAEDGLEGDNEDNINVENGDQPIFEGSDLSVGQIITMIYSQGLNWTTATAASAVVALITGRGALKKSLSSRPVWPCTHFTLAAVPFLPKYRTVTF